MGYRLSLDGLSLSFTRNSIVHTVSFDPCATCAFLMEAGQIEDFTQDANREPVILYTDEKSPDGYNGELWQDFVHYFPLTKEMAFALVQFKVERGNHARFQATVNHLLSPLAA